MANIFINYRRADSITAAFIIYNKLVEKKHTVFIDKEAIPVGFDFAAFIEKKIKIYDVMLTLIGNQWLTIKGNDKKLRLRNEGDHVRLELAKALQSSTIKVIPVLIDKVQMPEEKQLTADLKQLPKLNAVDFFSYEYDKSADRILAEIERTLNLLTSRDISKFVKIMPLTNDRGVVYTLKAAMETHLLAASGIVATINFASLDDDVAYVDKLKKGSGTYLLSALYAAEQFGVRFNLWKEKGNNRLKNSNTKHPTAARLKRYAVNTIDEMIIHLNAGRPILAVAVIYQTPWYSKQAAADGLILSLPKPNTASIGSQAILITHINLVKNRIKFAILWGKNWGDKGFGYFSEESFYKYVEQDKLYAIETVYY
jgi:TIR domain